MGSENSFRNNQLVFYAGEDGHEIVLEAALRLRNKMLAFRRRELDEAEALDLIDSAVARVSHFIMSGRGAAANLDGLLISVHRRIVNKHLKKQLAIRARLASILPFENRNPESDLVAALDVTLLLDRMDSRCRALVEALLSGKSASELAADLHMPRNTIYSSLRRCISRAAESATGKPCINAIDTALDRFPSTLGKLVYLACLSGGVSEALARVLLEADEPANHYCPMLTAAIRRRHYEIFRSWICLSGVQQFTDFRRYAAGVKAPPDTAALCETVPQAATYPERVHFQGAIKAAARMHLRIAEMAADTRHSRKKFR